jgi:hypothetical protein
MRTTTAQTFSGSDWFVFNYLVTFLQEILMTLKTGFRITMFFLEQFYLFRFMDGMAGQALSGGR